MSVFVASPVMAQNIDNQVFANQNVKAIELSQTEMKETQGDVIWFAPVLAHGLRIAVTGFTRHGLQQVMLRNGVGVAPKAMVNTLRNPNWAKSTSTIVGKNAGTTKYVGKDAVVILNKQNQIVSAWARNSASTRIKR